jgi:SAM-dependent methyltransferase
VEEQRYVIEETVQQRYVANRDAKTFLPFLLPHLHPGMDVLDAGCGVGSIALDLAPTIAPGRIVGIDLDPEQIELARKTAAERRIENVEFTTGSVLELPFDEATFDVVYANAVLFYLREQKPALVEMRRVLRPGGLAAVSDDDVSTVAVSPDWPELELAPRLFEMAVAHEGGNARYSRHLRTLMLEAGFARTEGVAHAPEVYGTEERTRWFAEFAVGLFGAPVMSQVIVDQGWASRDELDAMLAAFRRWGELPDAFAAWLYCGALGWVD